MVILFLLSNSIYILIYYNRNIVYYTLLFRLDTATLYILKLRCVSGIIIIGLESWDCSQNFSFRKLNNITAPSYVSNAKFGFDIPVLV